MVGTSDTSDIVKVLFVNQSSVAPDAICTILERRSKKYQYHFEIVNTAEAGRDMLNGQQLIFCGLGSSPTFDGYGFLEHVKRIERVAKRRYRVIFMTGFGEGERQTALDKGADAFLPIPYESMDQLVRLVEEVIERE